MGIVIGGQSVNTLSDVDSTPQALRVVQWPNDAKLLGAYALGVDNGSAVMAAGARTDQEIFSFRYSPSIAAPQAGDVQTYTALVLRSFAISCGTVIAFAAGQLKFNLNFATQYTVNPTGGQAVSSWQWRSQRKRSAQQQSAAGGSNVDIRIGQTGNLTSGTRILDAQPIATINAAATGVIGSVFPLNPKGTVDLIRRDSGDEYPVFITPLEGLILTVSCPATGTWYFGVAMEWEEIYTWEMT